MRGPALAAWYPRKTVSFRDLQDTYRPLGLTMFDEAEDDREEAIQMYALPSQPRHLQCSLYSLVRNLEEKADQRKREQRPVSLIVHDTYASFSFDASPNTY